MQDVVGVPPADTGDRALIAEDRVDAPGIVAGTDDVGELIGEHLGAEAVERSGVVGRQHPPTRLALGAELAHEHRLLAREAPPHDGALRLGALGRLLEVDAAGLREVEHDAARGLT